MNIVVSKPELSVQVPKSIFVLRPSSVEILRAVEAFLEDNPAPAICRLIAEDEERSVIIGVDEIDAIFSETIFKEVHAVAS